MTNIECWTTGWNYNLWLVPILFTMSTIY